MSSHKLITNQAHFQAPPFAVPTTPSVGWSTNPSPVAAPNQGQHVLPSFWGNTHSAVSYGPIVEPALHQVSPTQYASPNYSFPQEHHHWAPSTRSMSFGTIEGMPQQYPYQQEMPPQHALPGALPNFHFAPHPQPNTARLPSSENQQQRITGPRVEQQVPLPPFQFQKTWSGAQPGPNYSSAGAPHQQPPIANTWYPPPPHFANNNERPPFEQPQQYYPTSSHPG
jgi:hypothetical protein